MPIPRRGRFQLPNPLFVAMVVAHFVFDEVCSGQIEVGAEGS